MTQYIYGKNVVKQLLNSDNKIHEIILVEGLKDASIEQMIKQKNIKIKTMGRKKMDALLQNDHHQGIAALIDDFKTYSLESLIDTVKDKQNPLFVMLDGIEDPHNLGAILRTCDCIGVDGVIIGKHRNVKLNATVAKVSTGAIYTVKVAMVTNLTSSIKTLKKNGYWVVGADIENSIDYRKGTYDVPLVLVVGSEGFGISPLVKKNCDYSIRLPMEGSITSLNASVACAVLLYQIYNNRNPLK